MTPRQLLRFYPWMWRKRYGDEFVAMLEGATIDRAVVRDVLRNAAFERIFNSYLGRIVMGLVLTTLASFAALYLRDHVVAPPLIEPLADGGRVVTPPWPTELGVWGGGVSFMFVLRSFGGFFPRFRIRPPELMVWCALLLAASTVSQWSSLVFNDGTGIAAWPIDRIWRTQALMNCVALANSWVFSTVMNPRSLPPTPPVGGPSPRPLGLRG